MSARVRIFVAVGVAVVLIGGVVFAITRIGGRAPTAFALVDETTLVVLRGNVQLQRAGAALETVTADTPVRVGDLVRTGASSYAVVTYFDGSTTELGRRRRSSCGGWIGCPTVG